MKVLIRIWQSENPLDEYSPMSVFLCTSRLRSVVIKKSP